MSDRKLDHIQLTKESQVELALRDERFDYEPLLAGHLSPIDLGLSFLGKKLCYPIWISSMTGGTNKGQVINKNLAQLAHDYGLGMGLGSLRPLLEDRRFIRDFDVRQYIGAELPLYGNLGIAQVEELLISNKLHKLSELVELLSLDGIFIHINPMQEFLQPEGDRFSRSPLETLKELFKQTEIPILIKEVGSGMGPRSLAALFSLPITGFELAAWGGTNFPKLELLRQTTEYSNHFIGLCNIGHRAIEMIESANKINPAMPLIISGGIRDFLDGHYLLKKCQSPAVYGLASRLLENADDYKRLNEYMACEIEGLKFAQRFLWPVR